MTDSAITVFALRLSRVVASAELDSDSARSLHFLCGSSRCQPRPPGPAVATHFVCGSSRAQQHRLGHHRPSIFVWLTSDSATSAWANTGRPFSVCSHRLSIRLGHHWPAIFCVVQIGVNHICLGHHWPAIFCVAPHRSSTTSAWAITGRPFSVWLHIGAQQHPPGPSLAGHFLCGSTVGAQQHLPGPTLAGHLLCGSTVGAQQHLPGPTLAGHLLCGSTSVSATSASAASAAVFV